MNKQFLWRLGSCCLLFLLLLSACSFPGLVSTSAQLPSVSQKQATPNLPPISFPRDEGVHNDLTEWWYYTGHLEATDAAGKQDQNRITKMNEDSARGTVTKGIDVQVGNWSIQGLNGHDHLVAAMKDYAINLNLTGSKPPVLHNGNGLITYGLAGFSYYYSRTHMLV